MATEKATAIVLRTTDWSETSRIATLWTRELGKVRALAKGGRRLRSSFESGLDLLTVCSIVLIRKSSGGLDLLTEAQVVRRFARLSGDLEALYAAYFVAELLADWTTDDDPNPALFDEAIATLHDLSAENRQVPPRVLRFVMVFLRDTGFLPSLETCAGCGSALYEQGLGFSADSGGVLCPACRTGHHDRRPLSAAGWRALQALAGEGDWAARVGAGVCGELRPMVGAFLTHLRGRPPKLLAYLGG
jgi:DNA repair protein RecO (recombination protein O)